VHPTYDPNPFVAHARGPIARYSLRFCYRAAVTRRSARTPTRVLDDVAERENGETRTDRAIHRSPLWGEQGDGGKTGGAEECETRACEVTLRCVTRRFVALRTIARNFTSDSMLGYIDRVDKPVVGLSRDLRDISSTRPAIVLMRTIPRARAHARTLRR